MFGHRTLAPCFVAIFVALVVSQANAQLFAASFRFDVFNGTARSWKELPLSGVQQLRASELGFDSLGNIYISYALVGPPNGRPFPLQVKFSPGNTSNIVSSLFNGRFALDRGNFEYNIDRYTPVGTCFDPITKIDTTDLTTGDTIGYATNVADIVFDGRSIVIVGNFLRVYSGDLAHFARTNYVARFINGDWEPIDGGLNSPPTRVVADANRNLVALIGTTLWRWNGITWTSYPLDLTAATGTPSIVDLDFGRDLLFVTGNFLTINGVSSSNVAALSWNIQGVLTVSALNGGIPNIVAASVLAERDNTLIWVGGSVNNTKAVYSLINGTWVNLGPLSPKLNSEDTTVTALLFISR